MDCCRGFALWRKLFEILLLSTGMALIQISTIAFSTSHSLFVEKGGSNHMALLLVMLEVMSRMMEAIWGSFCIRSSTLRMELSTVA